MGDPSIAELESWSEKHWETTQKLITLGDDWSVVTGFYSCYHLLRAAMLKDPLFDDLPRLSVVHHSLRTEDRRETKHSKGGLNKPELGMKEICTLVYPHASGKYYLAHDASNGVRYDGGLPRHIHSVSAALGYSEFFRDAYYSGHLDHDRSLAIKASSAGKK